VFGSVLTADDPADVDLIIVYELPLTPLTASSVGSLLDAVARRVAGLPAHMMFFTPAEASRKAISDMRAISVAEISN